MKNIISKYFSYKFWISDKILRIYIFIVYLQSPRAFGRMNNNKIKKSM